MSSIPTQTHTEFITDPLNPLSGMPCCVGDLSVGGACDV